MAHQPPARAASLQRPSWLCWPHGTRPSLPPPEGSAAIAQGPCPLHQVRIPWDYWVPVISLATALSGPLPPLPSESSCCSSPPSPLGGRGSLQPGGHKHQLFTNTTPISASSQCSRPPLSPPASSLWVGYGHLKSHVGTLASQSQSVTH